MARAGMATLISDVRQMASAGSTDHTIAGVTYWTDDQIQARLDVYRNVHKEIPLMSLPDYASNDYTYTEYAIPNVLEWFEEEGSASGWSIRDENGSAAPSHSVNYKAKMVTFAADTNDRSYYLNCRTYDVYSAVADIWESKAGFLYQMVDWSSDNHNVKASQQRDFCLKRAEEYRSMGGGAVSFGRFVRVDEAPLYRDANDPINWGE